MKIHRISHHRWRTEFWTGNGGIDNDGRWNTKGHRVIYASESRALSTLETLVHENRLSRLKEFCLGDGDVPDEFIQVLDIKSLPEDWRNPAYDPGTQAIGDKWLEEKKDLAMKVPSAVIPEEWDVLINPEHPNFKKITARSPKLLNIDPRLCR